MTPPPVPAGSRAEASALDRPIEAELIRCAHEMGRAAFAVESEGNSNEPYMQAVIQGNRSIAAVMRRAADEVAALRQRRDDLEKALRHVNASNHGFNYNLVDGVWTLLCGECEIALDPPAALSASEGREAGK